MQILLFAIVVLLAFAWLLARMRRPGNGTDGGGNGGVHGGDSGNGDCGDGGGGGD